MRSVNVFGIATAAAIVGAGVTAYGAVSPRSQLFGSAISQTPAFDELALTFDDGPNPAITPRLLDLLDRFDAKATFFMVGRFVRMCPELAREVLARGHRIGNHTQTHPNLFWLGGPAIRSQLELCSGEIGAATGALPRLFRPPYGFRNPLVIPAAKKLGMLTVTWSSIPGDWRGKPAEWLIERMSPLAKRLETLRDSGNARNPGRASGGPVVCLHDGGHSALNADRSSTVAAVEYWLPRWRDIGFKFATIENAVNATAP